MFSRNKETHHSHVKSWGLVFLAGIAFLGLASCASLSQDVPNGDKRVWSAGPNPNQANAGGETLSMAAYRGHANVVKLLLAQGANPNLANNNGVPTLFTDPFFKSFFGNPFSSGSYRKTPLYLASIRGHADVVRILLSHGATPTQKDLNAATGESKVLIQEALNRQKPSIPVISKTNLPPSVSPAPPAAVSTTQSAPSPPSVSSKQNPSKIEEMLAKIQSEIDAKKFPSKTTPAPVYHSPVDHPSFKLRENRNAFAVVIGVEHYPGGIPTAEFADRDATAVVQTMRALGVPYDHIKQLTDETATRSRLDGALHWLARNVRFDSTVWVYFSGHGAPGQKGTAYLVPFDGDPTDLSDTGFRIETLYRKLNALKARHIIVALDSCFSGQGSRSVIGVGVRPLVTKIREGAFPSSGKLVAFSAAKSDQEAGVLKDQGHGLFTYYFLKGLDNGAVRHGHVTIAGLYRYLGRRVTDKANLDNRSQTPEIEPRSLGPDALVSLR